MKIFIKVTSWNYDVGGGRKRLKVNREVEGMKVKSKRSRFLFRALLVVTCLVLIVIEEKTSWSNRTAPECDLRCSTATCRGTMSFSVPTHHPPTVLSPAAILHARVHAELSQCSGSSASVQHATALGCNAQVMWLNSWWSPERESQRGLQQSPQWQLPSAHSVVTPDTVPGHDLGQRTGL